MAFGRITKQDLVDAGLDPDKLKDFQEKGVTKDMLDTMKTELTASLTEGFKTTLATTLEDFKKGLGEVIVGRRDGNNNNNNNNNNDNKNNNNEEVIDPMAFLEDPMGHVKKEVGKAYMAGNIQLKKTQYDYSYDRLSRELKGFANTALKEEIDAKLKEYTPEVMALRNIDPNRLITEIHNLVMGTHHDDIIKDTNARTGKFSLVGSSGGSGGNNTTVGNNNTPERKPEEILTAEELKQAAHYKMTPEEWLESKETMFGSKVGA